MKTLQALRVQPGQAIKADHHNGLVDLAESLTIQRGRLKGRRAPDGFTPLVKLPALSASGDPAWDVTIDGTAERVTLTISPGHVEGIVPQINGIALDDVDAQGNPPALLVDPGAWRAQGRVERALLMLRYNLREGDFAVVSVDPIVVPAVPAFQPLTWHKLLGFLRRFQGDIEYFPQAFFPQYFTVSEVHGQSFKPWPRAGA